MEYSKFETLSITREGHIARLRSTRPELLNRIDEPAHRELIAAFRELHHDREIRAILWTAEGRAFSAGGDLQEIYGQNKDINRRLEMYQQAKDIIHALLDIPVPLVVSLHSHAYGLAATLVMIADAIVACPNARIADTHVKVGLVAGDGGVIGWPSILGMMRAKYHLLTGEPITAEEGYRMGMITKLADNPEECEKVALALAQQMASLPPIAVQGTKRTFNAALRARANEVLETGLLFEQGSLATADLIEAVEAFKEKREPTYHGH